MLSCKRFVADQLSVSGGRRNLDVRTLACRGLPTSRLLGSSLRRHVWTLTTRPGVHGDDWTPRSARPYRL